MSCLSGLHYKPVSRRLQQPGVGVDVGTVQNVEGTQLRLLLHEAQCKLDPGVVVGVFSAVRQTFTALLERAARALRIPALVLL